MGENEQAGSSSSEARADARAQLQYGICLGLSSLSQLPLEELKKIKSKNLCVQTWGDDSDSKHSVCKCEDAIPIPRTCFKNKN